MTVTCIQSFKRNTFFMKNLVREETKCITSFMKFHRKKQKAAPPNPLFKQLLLFHSLPWNGLIFFSSITKENFKKQKKRSRQLWVGRWWWWSKQSLLEFFFSFFFLIYNGKLNTFFLWFSNETGLPAFEKYEYETESSAASVKTCFQTEAHSCLFPYLTDKNKSLGATASKQQARSKITLSTSKEINSK